MRTELKAMALDAKERLAARFNKRFILPHMRDLVREVLGLGNALREHGSTLARLTDEIERLKMMVTPTRALALKLESTQLTQITKLTRVAQRHSKQQHEMEALEAKVAGLEAVRDKLMARADGIFTSHHEMAIRIAALEMEAKQRSAQTIEILDKMQTRFDEQKKAFGDS